MTETEGPYATREEFIADLVRERAELLHNRDVERKEHAERDERMKAEVTKLHKTIAGLRVSLKFEMRATDAMAEKFHGSDAALLSERRRQEIVRLQRRVVNQRKELREMREANTDLANARDAAINRIDDIKTTTQREIDAMTAELHALQARQGDGYA